MTTTFVSLMGHLQHLKSPLRVGVDASTMTEQEEKENLKDFREENVDMTGISFNRTIDDGRIKSNDDP